MRLQECATACEEVPSQLPSWAADESAPSTAPSPWELPLQNLMQALITALRAVSPTTASMLQPPSGRPAAGAGHPLGSAAGLVHVAVATAWYRRAERVREELCMVVDEVKCAARALSKLFGLGQGNAGAITPAQAYLQDCRRPLQEALDQCPLSCTTVQTSLLELSLESTQAAFNQVLSALRSVRIRRACSQIGQECVGLCPCCRPAATLADLRRACTAAHLGLVVDPDGMRAVRLSADASMSSKLEELPSFAAADG